MQYYDAARVSALMPSPIVEQYIPLWVADGTNNNFMPSTTPGNNFLADGAGGYPASSSASRIFTLSSTWSPTQKFSLECTIAISASGATAYFALWDFTSGSLVSASQVSTTSTTMSVVRSPQFTLTPGHSYGITAWLSGSGNANISDAHLIVFPQ